jgi:hypothetical protein
VSKITNLLNVAAVKITDAVGTMYCAMIFAALTFVSLPNVLASGDLVQIVSWVAQTFLQLVLLSVIMVGQNIQATEVARLIAQIEANTAKLIADMQADHEEDVEDLKQILKALHADVIDLAEPAVLTPVS